MEQYVSTPLHVKVEREKKADEGDEEMEGTDDREMIHSP